MKRWRRWYAIPVTFALLALAGAIVLAARLARPPAPGRKGTLSGVTSCTNGSLSLARFDCSTWPCGDTPSESVFLRWNEQEVTVRMHHEGTPIPRSPTGQPQLELMERPISPALLPGLLAEFAVLPRSPADPAWLPDVRLRDIFEVVGECDDSWLSADLAARRLNLVATLKSAPAGDAPQVLMLWVRGPGPRAERLFSRLEKLTRVDR